MLPPRPLTTALAALALLEACATRPPQRTASSVPPPSPSGQVWSREVPSEPEPAPASEPAEPAPPEPAPPAEPPVAPEPPEPDTLYPFNQPLPPPDLPADSAASQHANLSPAACRQEVKRRKLPVKRDRRPTPGVATALRFTGPLNGVRFVTAGWKSPFGVMDCRLVLAFESMADALHELGVVQVNVGTIYRRGSKLHSNKPSQHAYALAADILGFGLEDGSDLVIERDFAGEIGQPVCGPESRLGEASGKAITLRNIICDLARRQLFNYMLTPNYDQAHHDHLHVDIVRNGKRGVIR